MSDTKRSTLTAFHHFCIEVVKVGRVPKHIAFIMDGNRRYVEKHSLGPRISGASKGVDTLQNTIEWCLLLSVEEVTVFAFSIENFKRSEQEVTDLMNLIRMKLSGNQSELDVLNKFGVRVKFVGRLSLLEEDIIGLLSEVESTTRNNTKLLLNISIAYTGRDDISRATSRIIKGVQNGEWSPEDVNEQLVSQVVDLSEPALLVRTSGEVRLSDFMLWQISNTVLYFTKVLWPEFTLWNLLAAIIHYQRNAPTHRNGRNRKC